MDWSIIGDVIGVRGAAYMAAATSLYLAGWKSCEKILVQPERKNAADLKIKLEELQRQIQTHFWNHLQ